MKKFFIYILSIYLATFIYSCGGGGDATITENNNSNTSTNLTATEVSVSGKVSNVSTLSIKAQNTNTYPLYVIAVDQDINFYKEGVNADGSFSINLPKGKNYVFMFQKNTGEFIATLIINNYTGLTIDQDINLGSINIDLTKKEAKITDIQKEQELASKVSQDFNIKTPDDIKIKNTSKYIDISVLSSKDIIRGSIAFDGNASVGAFISKFYNRSGQIYEVVFIPNGQACNNPFDANCYRVSEYGKVSKDAGYYYMGYKCKLNEDTGNWEENNSRNIKIPLYIEIGKEYDAGSIDNRYFKVKVPKVNINFDMQTLGFKTNISQIDLIPLEIIANSITYQTLWFSKYGELFYTSKPELTKSEIENSIKGNAINFTPDFALRFTINENNKVSYIGYGNIPSDVENQIKNLNSNLPDPFQNIPSACTQIK